MSQAANQDGQRGEIVVAYTVWSRKRGAGKEIINKLREWTIKNKFSTACNYKYSNVTNASWYVESKSACGCIS